MKTLFFTLVAGAAALSFSTARAEVSQRPSVIRSADIAVTPGVFSPELSKGLFQEAQWFWGGRHYCWYEFGWHGPGYYWCGYSGRRGYGWGGPVGWHGWSRGPVYRGGGWHGGHGGGFHGGGHGGWHGGGGGHGHGGGGHHH